MKLATFKDGSRDGQLVVVSRDLSSAHFATGIASRLQQVLDDWNFLSPQLEDLYLTLNQGKARHAFEFVAALCMAPLPRTAQWAAGAACDDKPALVHAAGDDLHGPCDDAGFDFARQKEIECAPALAAITGDVRRGATPEPALEGVRLLALAQVWRVRDARPGAQPSAAFAPVAVTPDELGEAWQAGRVHLPLQVRRNGERVARIDAGEETKSGFGPRIALLAHARQVRAGTIVGAVFEAPGAEGGPPVAAGDSFGLEAVGRDGQSVFGALAQPVTAATAR